MDSVTDTKWFQYLFFIIVVGFGAVFTYLPGRELIQYRSATTRYLPVEARILSHELKEVVDHEGDPSWTPVISYEYAVGGQIYQSKNVTPLPLASFKDWAESVLDRFPVGTVQTAYYDPVQPDQAYLHRTKFSAVYYGALGFGVLLLVLGSSKLIELSWKTIRS